MVTTKQTLVVFCLTLASAALATERFWPTSQPIPQIRIGSQTYTNAELFSASSSNALIRTDSGIHKVSIQELPANLRDKCALTPKQIEESEPGKASSQIAWQRVYGRVENIRGNCAEVQLIKSHLENPGPTGYLGTSRPDPIVRIGGLPPVYSPRGPVVKTEAAGLITITNRPRDIRENGLYPFRVHFRGSSKLFGEVEPLYDCAP